MKSIRAVLFNRRKSLSRVLRNIRLNGVINEIILNPILRIINIRLTSHVTSQVSRDTSGIQDKTSITDSNSYAGYAFFCQEVSMDENLFKVFRSDPLYKDVLEHVPHYLGVEYARRLKGTVSVQRLRNRIKLIDQEGSPWRFRYRSIGLASPTTLRYMYLAKLMQSLISPNQVRSVCEIGCGFGGQSLALVDFYNISEYTFVDLPSVLDLTKRYIQGSKTSFVSNFNSHEEQNRKKFDLLVSNYAFSELTREYQDKYMREYVMNASSGFILWNPLSVQYLDGYSLPELLSKIPGALSIPEDPSSFEGNCVIYWN